MERTEFTVAFDDETVELLMELAAETGCEPRKLITSIVRGVLEDDACAHVDDYAQRPKVLN